MAGVSSNAAVLAARLEAQAEVLVPAATAVVAHHAMLLETAIKAAASGRPRPNAPTGDYRRSWTTSAGVTGAGVEAVVGTNNPQAARLEYGFSGADSLGRIYHQPPLPHVGPSVDRLAPALTAALGQLAERIVR